ncbi:hypothetical protein MRX96_046558 [Rhipicephalus microplus]
MPNRRRNYCFAPGGRTGYSRVQDAPQASLFSVPRDEERRKEWERNLHRAYKKLDEFSAACELHFEPRFVMKEFVPHIDGKEVRIPRDKPMLSKNAVPTILPNLPQYLRKKMPKPRAKRKMCENDHAAAKKKSRSALETDCTEFPRAAVGNSGEDCDLTHDDVPAEPEHCLSFCYCLKTPSKYCSMHHHPDLNGGMYCSSTYLEEGVVTSENSVLFLCDKPPDGYCKVFVRGAAN